MKNLIIGISFVAAIVALCLSLNNMKQSRQVYVDMGKVYSEFQLSKELNNKMEEVLKARKNITDSLYLDVKQKTQELRRQPKQTLDEMAKVAKLEEGLYYKQQQFEKENQAVSADYSNKIWTQLNQYVADYGAKSKCTFILGANGQGNIMYADKTYDITEDVIKYVNDRYNDRIKE
jgi:outer membrane protein